MKRVFYARLFVVIVTLHFGQGVVECKPATVEPTIKIVKVSPTGSIALEINNPSMEPLKLWQESNSWGAARWRLLRIRHGQIEVFFQNPNQIFTANIPTFDTIAPGAHIKHTLDVNGGNWCGLGHCVSYNERGLGGKKISFEANDTIIVVYDVPLTDVAEDMYVWHGVAAAFKTVE